MKNYSLIICLILGVAPYMNAQEKTFSVTARGSYMVPVGSLNNRFLPGYGGAVDVAFTRGTPTWSCSIEYARFSRENRDKLTLTRAVRDSATRLTDTLTVALPRLSMSLELIGVSANATYDLWLNTWSVAKFGFGFGIYHWKGNRSAYYDTLRTTARWGTAIVATPQVPELNQEDWSGGLSGGVDYSMRIFSPVWFTVGARYRLIVGELWSTLALDLENVSTFQMLDLRAGISVDF